MKKRLLILSLIALVSVGTSAQAQIKLPVFDEGADDVKNVVFVEATKAKDYQHGRLVRVTPKGSDKAIEGILVRVDGKSERIYVRTQPGMPPRAFDAKEVTKIEKGTIKQASYTQDVTRPEIQPMVITNGSRTSVSYSAPTLSPSELSVLRELENSENALKNMEFTASRAQLSQDIEIGIQAEHLRTQKLQNELLWRQIYDFYHPRYVPWVSAVTANTSSVSAGGGASPAVNAEAMTKARQSYTNAQNRLVYQGGQPVAVIIDDAK